MRTSPSDSVQAAFINDSQKHETWQVNFFSTLQEMAPVIETVVMLMEELGYTVKDVFRCRLVLEEAICNAIKHGHRYDPTKVVEVRYTARADHFLVEVQDQGIGFDPAQVPDATSPENLARRSGRGLLLMRHYAAWVRHNRQGTCVTFGIWPAERTRSCRQRIGASTAPDWPQGSAADRRDFCESGLAGHLLSTSYSPVHLRVQRTTLAIINGPWRSKLTVASSPAFRSDSLPSRSLIKTLASFASWNVQFLTFSDTTSSFFSGRTAATLPFTSTRSCEAGSSVACEVGSVIPGSGWIRFVLTVKVTMYLPSG
jgi:serine/threonine-protein kinase RsbW